jgi:moderate conductance mechanosensitive channel
VVLAILALFAPASPTHAQPPPTPTPAVTSTQAQQVLDVLKDDAQRARFISVLESMAHALPAPAPAPSASPAPAPAPAASAPPAAPASPSAPAAPAAPATPAAAAPSPLSMPLVPDSVGAELLVGASERLAHLSSDVMDTVRTITDFPQISRWAVHVAHDPASHALMLDAGWKLAVVLAAALSAEWILLRLLRGVSHSLAEHAPAAHPREPKIPEEAEGLAEAEAGQFEKQRRRPSTLTLLRRLPFVLARFLIDLVPVLAVATVGYGLLGSVLGQEPTSRLIILAVLNAYIVTRIAAIVTRMLVSPGVPRLRLVHVSDADARAILIWVRRIAAVGIFGYAAAEVGLLFGLYRAAHDALLKLVSLAIHGLLVIVVLRSRAAVADRIRAAPGATGALALLRNRLARVWHIVAIFYLVALWLVWAFEVPNGFARLVQVFVSTLIVGVIARMVGIAAVGAVDRMLKLSEETAARHPGLEARLGAYHPLARLGVSLLIAAIAVVAVFQAWGLNAVSWFASGLGARLLAALATVAVTLLLSLLLWELANAAIERHLARLSRESQAARSARLRTLLPMLRTTLLITICTVAGLMMLSEIGVNIAPLLAGAGVLGLAIGFGSQKLVQDIITGLFLLLENTMQVGDVVTLGGLSGTVENLSIRTIRLRALDGSVHIVPFSAVTTVTNMTRDFGYAVVDVSVGLNEEPDRITALVKDLAAKMRDEPRWETAIRDDLDVLGVEKFLDTAWVLRVRLKTVAGQRWAVGRELNRRIKMCFDELAIESPWTSHRVLSTVPPPPSGPARVPEENPA